jgi:hypothetical protein
LPVRLDHITPNQFESVLYALRTSLSRSRLTLKTAREQNKIAQNKIEQKPEVTDFQRCAKNAH